MIKYYEKIAENIGYKCVKTGNIELSIDILECYLYDNYDDSLYESIDFKLTNLCNTKLINEGFKDFIKQYSSSEWNPALNPGQRIMTRVGVENKASEVKDGAEIILNRIKDDPSYNPNPSLLGKLSDVLGKKKVIRSLGKGVLKAFGDSGRKKLINFLEKRANKQIKKGEKLKNNAIENMADQLYKDQINDLKLRQSIGLGPRQSGDNSETYDWSKEGTRQGIKTGLHTMTLNLFKKNPRKTLDKAYKTAHKGHKLNRFVDKLKTSRF